MKPHAIRRSLWFSSLVVGAGFVAAAAHFALNVRPATAQVLDRGARTIEQRWRDMADAYRRDADTAANQANRQQGPVDQATMKSTLLRYGSPRNPRWFPFVGPPAPPEKSADPVTRPAEPEAPKGLDAIGKIIMFTDRTLTFEFAGAPKESAIRPIPVGDFIRASDSAPKRFRLVALEPVAGSAAMKVVYEVLASNGDREGELQSQVVGAQVFDRKLADIISGFKVAGGPAEAASGAPGMGPDGTVLLGPDGLPVAAAPGAEGTATAEGTASTVVQASEDGDGRSDLLGLDTELTRPVEDLTTDDLKPRVVQYSDTERAVVFDRNTYEFVRSRGQALAETVKTEEALDPGTGRVIGVRITGYDPGQAPVSALDVKRGDILKSINGRPVTSRAQAIEIGQTLREDALVRVVIERAGRDITYVVDPQDPKTRRNIRYFDNLK